MAPQRKAKDLKGKRQNCPPVSQKLFCITFKEHKLPEQAAGDQPAACLYCGVYRTITSRLSCCHLTFHLVMPVQAIRLSLEKSYFCIIDSLITECYA